MELIETGKILIAEPFLLDPYFFRTVIILCDHNENGSMGFILNRQLHLSLGEVLKNNPTSNFPVSYGGPLQNNSLFYIHDYPAELKDSIYIADGIYFGGRYKTLVEMIEANYIQEDKIRFFIGYASWQQDQLKKEMKEKSWIITDCEQDIVFDVPSENLWKESLLRLGDEYKLMANFPIHPQLN